MTSTPSCKTGFHLTQFPGGYNISADGSFGTSEFIAPFLTYCLDYFLSTDEPNADPLLKAMVCFDANKPRDERGLVVVPPGAAILFGIAMIISAICLAIAAIVSYQLKL